MKDTFTKNQIIKYIYNDLSTSEKLRVEESLNKNFELREFYESTLTAYNSLSKVQFDPKQEAINKILGYSQSAQLEALH